MNAFKSLFVFTKEQRKGILLLLLIIVTLQCIYFFVDFSSQEIVVDSDELKKYEAKIDSLRLVQIKSRKPRLYPFNPNFITDYKGSILGMTNEEIDRLLKFRATGQWVKSTHHFQSITKVSDSLLNTIAPYFKFPERNINVSNKINDLKRQKTASLVKKKDLNTATAKDLQKINGVGAVLSKRIIKYRNRFKGGFTLDEQLKDVYGLKLEVISNIKAYFTVKTPARIKKIDINTANIEQLVTVHYIDYEIAHNIVEYRLSHGNYKTLDELKKVKDFPASKIDIIKLSLSIR